MAPAPSKPLVPHKDGISCVSCGATTASKWRGINGDHCSTYKCKQAAAEERAAKGGQGELEQRVEELESVVAALQQQLSAQRRGGWGGR